MAPPGPKRRLCEKALPVKPHCRVTTCYPPPVAYWVGFHACRDGGVAAIKHGVLLIANGAERLDGQGPGLFFFFVFFLLVSAPACLLTGLAAVREVWLMAGLLAGFTGALTGAASPWPPRWPPPAAVSRARHANSVGHFFLFFGA